MADRNLPIWELHSALLAEATSHRRFVLTAPTASGKSTQVPQMLLDAGLLGDGQVVILQPRRLAARLLAARVAHERGCLPGEEVGYQIRFDNVTSPRTRIRFVTEGVLLRQMITDSALRGVQAILFDEFHERHLYGDITLARALQLQETVRPDLLLGVMSATLDTDPLEQYLHPCALLSSAGRTFPVEIEYLPPGKDNLPLWELAVRELERLLRQHPDGDALVFMPGAYEIHRTVQTARATLGADILVLPLHGELPAAEQDAAVARHPRRKVVVATNVAETSITIDGVRLVVDSGLARIPRYDPHRGINTLWVEKISRASADQRAGRAGRTAPGHCLRLWTRRDHDLRPPRESPEIQRLDLAEVVLALKASGIEDVRSFRWLDPPDPRSLERAETLLADLGALEPADGADHLACPNPPTTITPLGRRMLAFPVHPRYARMLLEAQQHGCVRSVALLAALTQGPDLFLRRVGREVREAREELFGGETCSDFFVLQRAWRYAEQNRFSIARCQRLGIQAQAARQVGPLFEQFCQIASREGLDVAEVRPVPPAAVQKCLLVGFADHLARRLDAGTLRCELVHGRRGVLDRDSVVTSPLFVSAEVREIEGRDKELSVVLGLNTAVEEAWLRELFPRDFHETRALVYDPGLRRVMLRQERRFRDLVLERTSSEVSPGEPAARILAEQVLHGACVLKAWDESVEQWILRLNRLREWMPELNLPALTADDRLTLLQQICQGATSYKEIKDRPVAPVVRSWLNAQQQHWLDTFAPDRIELPNGRRAKLVYSATDSPLLSARIQDLYGVEGNLRIAQGRVVVRIQVLAPNHRPVQITDDLARFWQEQYPRLKQQLQRKYPKHEWR